LLGELSKRKLNIKKLDLEKLRILRDKSKREIALQELNPKKQKTDELLGDTVPMYVQEQPEENRGRRILRADWLLESL